jgi:hypothetical protein
MTQARELHPVGNNLFVDVYDFTTDDRPPGLEAGFYYNIPVDDAGNHDRDTQVQPEGPFASSSEALEAGIGFIADALGGTPEGGEYLEQVAA